MANRFVRPSKFRHVYGSAAKKAECFDSLRITKSPIEAYFIAVNSEFLALCIDAGGGGAFVVLPLDKVFFLDRFPCSCLPLLARGGLTNINPSSSYTMTFCTFQITSKYLHTLCASSDMLCIALNLYICCLTLVTRADEHYGPNQQ